MVMEKRRKGKEGNSEERGRDDGIKGGSETEKGTGEPRGRGEGTQK